MTQDYPKPIAPPPELVQQWRKSGPADAAVNDAYERHIATRAAQWGADQELEACIDWISVWHGLEHPELLIELLRAARRPKPPSLKEQALALLNKAEDPSWDINDFSIVRRALEQLDD
jgi:hypothetical protein